MRENEVEALNKFLKDDLLGYIIEKYPKSEEKGVNQTFKNIVSQVTNRSDNENDLVFRSKVKFQYQDDGNYNSQIMEFLNYLIELPDDEVTADDGKKHSLEDAFHKQLKAFFKQVENEEKLAKMKFDEKDR